MQLEQNMKDHPQLVSLAQKIEALAYADMFAAAPPEYALEHGLRVQHVSGATCFAHKDLPVSLFNRVLGLGTAVPVTKNELNAVVDWLRAYAHPNFNVGIDVNTRPRELNNWLESMSLYSTGGGIARFALTRPQRGVDAESDLTIRSVGADERDTAGKLIRDAFGFPSYFDRWLGQIAGRENWRVYFACDADKPVAVGAMYIKDNLAWLGVGATLKEYRGRGAQTLLLNKRIEDALRIGVGSVHVETGHPAAGESIGPSYRNILRAGFELLFVRQQFMPASAPRSSPTE